MEEMITTCNLGNGQKCTLTEENLTLPIYNGMSKIIKVKNIEYLDITWYKGGRLLKTGIGITGVALALIWLFPSWWWLFGIFWVLLTILVIFGLYLCDGCRNVSVCSIIYRLNIREHMKATNAPSDVKVALLREDSHELLKGFVVKANEYFRSLDNEQEQ